MASELCNSFLRIYYDQYNELWDYKRNKMDHKYKPEELFLEEYNYDDWSDTKKKKVIKKNHLMKNLLIYFQSHH